MSLFNKIVGMFAHDPSIENDRDEDEWGEDEWDKSSDSCPDSLDPFYQNNPWENQ